MAELQIRRYEDRDEEEVKEVFTLGMFEHVPSSCMHVLKQPHVQMLLACLFCALLASSKSILLPVLAVALLLAAGRQGISHMFYRYIEESMRKDLNSVRKTYMEGVNSCFWVAEWQGRVVGTVACLPAEQNAGCLELKRMSVRQSHRRRGIAKALCDTVAEFARLRGFPAVVLATSVVQTDAQKLYGRLGYEKMWYQIREYQDSDYSSVRELYSTSFREHEGAVCVLTLKQRWVQIALLGLSILFLFLFGSVLASVLCLSGVLLAGRFAVFCLFEQGVQLGLREDLQDIRASYMHPGKISCFWVAESKGSLLGTVGILPCVTEPGAWELKRISVRKGFWQRGLAKALCLTTLQFAARNKVERVVLFTSLSCVTLKQACSRRERLNREATFLQLAALNEHQAAVLAFSWIRLLSAGPRADSKSHPAITGMERGDRGMCDGRQGR
ncbi:putative N-acetyltransferase CML1 [Clarias magur]|uniref:Putative N-acetyltransferase CML1 n=1 Tax=Clarias magur TaxID=1594786 RepID=A0A8J4XBY1_CLAMG|nr:putative N-acetyltransferase CML1 [Clarias magur]